MRNWILAVAALASIEAAAIACSCIATDDPVELKRLGAETAKGAVAIVEAEALTSYVATRTGEQMRVTRFIAGTAPVRFTIERGGSPSSASCDVLYEVGQRAVIILYPAANPAAAPQTFRTSGLCSVHLLEKPVFLEAAIKAVGAPRRGERG